MGAKLIFSEPKFIARLPEFDAPAFVVSKAQPHQSSGHQRNVERCLYTYAEPQPTHVCKANYKVRKPTFTTTIASKG